MVELPTRRIKTRDLSIMNSALYAIAEEVWLDKRVGDHHLLKIGNVLGIKRSIELFRKWKTWPDHPSHRSRVSTRDFQDEATDFTEEARTALRPPQWRVESIWYTANGTI